MRVGCGYLNAGVHPKPKSEGDHFLEVGRAERVDGGVLRAWGRKRKKRKGPPMLAPGA